MADTNATEKGEIGPPPAYGYENSNAPPSYNNEPPPSYEAMFGRVRQMRDESDGNADFAKKMIGCVFCGTVCSILTIVIMIAIPIACMVFGSLYLGECNIERYIPIYLVVAGVFGLIKAVINIVQQVCKRKSGEDSGDEEEPSTMTKCLRFIDGPLSCFLLAWFISGSVWVYRIHKKFDGVNTTSPLYCNPTLYQFAFWILTVQYIMLALCVCCCCLGMLIVSCTMCKKQEGS